tara:strand:- start:441 stop:689 length:249 start_codon:yes stop_codon:yes gene_type:complete
MKKPENKKLFQIVGFYGYQCYLDVYANNKEEVWKAIEDEKIDAGTLCKINDLDDSTWEWRDVYEIKKKDMVLGKAGDLDESS